MKKTTRGQRPYGYALVDQVVVENPHEQQIIQYIKELREDQRASDSRIAAIFNHTGLKSRSKALGGKWLAKSVHTLIDALNKAGHNIPPGKHKPGDHDPVAVELICESRRYPSHVDYRTISGMLAHAGHRTVGGKRWSYITVGSAYRKLEETKDIRVSGREISPDGRRVYTTLGWRNWQKPKNENVPI